MEVHVMSQFSPATSRVDAEELVEVKKGPWTADEDALLMNYVSVHGEGRWNSIARSAGLNRTGKSCRLRWLNYLRPDLCRGSITLQEQLLILELHSRWGNRWSKIAQYLPGRTDNEIKNYWRTRVQKQAKQLKCDVNSKQFRDAMHNVWMPRLREQIESSSTGISPARPADMATHAAKSMIDPTGSQAVYQTVQSGWSGPVNLGFSSEIPAVSSSDSCPDTAPASLVSDPSEHYDPWDGSCIDSITEAGSCSWPESLFDYPGLGSGGIEYEQSNYWTGEEDLMMENLWNDESIWLLQQQLFDGMDGNCTDR